MEGQEFSIDKVDLISFFDLNRQLNQVTKMNIIENVIFKFLVREISLITYDQAKFLHKSEIISFKTISEYLFKSKKILNRKYNVKIESMDMKQIFYFFLTLCYIEDDILKFKESLISNIVFIISVQDLAHFVKIMPDFKYELFQKKQELSSLKVEAKSVLKTLKNEGYFDCKFNYFFQSKEQSSKISQNHCINLKGYFDNSYFTKKLSYSDFINSNLIRKILSEAVDFYFRKQGYIKDLKIFKFLVDFLSCNSYISKKTLVYNFPDFKISNTSLKKASSFILEEILEKKSLKIHMPPNEFRSIKLTKTGFDLKEVEKTGFLDSSSECPKISYTKYFASKINQSPRIKIVRGVLNGKLKKCLSKKRVKVYKSFVNNDIQIAYNLYADTMFKHQRKSTEIFTLSEFEKVMNGGHYPKCQHNIVNFSKYILDIPYQKFSKNFLKNFGMRMKNSFSVEGPFAKILFHIRVYGISHIKKSTQERKKLVIGDKMIAPPSHLFKLDKMLKQFLRNIDERKRQYRKLFKEMREYLRERRKNNELQEKESRINYTITRMRIKYSGISKTKIKKLNDIPNIIEIIGPIESENKGSKGKLSVIGNAKQIQLKMTKLLEEGSLDLNDFKITLLEDRYWKKIIDLYMIYD